MICWNQQNKTRLFFDFRSSISSGFPVGKTRQKITQQNSKCKLWLSHQHSWPSWFGFRHVSSILAGQMINGHFRYLNRGPYHIYIYKLCQAYFKIGYVRGYTPNFYGEIYGTFTYLHVLDPFLFPLTIVYQVSKIHHPYIAHITRDVSIYSWHTLGLLHMIANLVSGMHIQVYTYCHVMGTYI